LEPPHWNRGIGTGGEPAALVERPHA
jgi:hypothetical protein